VYFDQFLDDGDTDDFESVARELSKFALTVTCFAEQAPAIVKCFQNALETQQQFNLEHPDLSFDEIEASNLTGYEKLEFEAGKPGLAEFFGRSEDE
jgi:ABC-type nitrate/sulfonate/bicarbonate transport system substrate-binding protein